MSKIVKSINRYVLENALKDNSAVRSIEGVVNYCINAIPEVAQHEESVSGDTINIQSIQASEFYNVWLVIHAPAGHLTSLTIVFPLGTGLNAPLPRQEVLITSEHNITSLTLDGNGATIVNTVTSLGAGSSVRYKFLGGKWYRIH